MSGGAVEAIGQMTIKPIGIKPTKTSLRKIIDWSSSRYCEDKKEDVVNSMLRILKRRSGVAEYTTGSYSPRGHLGGWTWRVNGDAGTVTRIPGHNGEPKSVFVVTASGEAEKAMTEPTDLQGWRDKLRRLEDELSAMMDDFVATEDPADREVIVQVEDRLAGQIAEAQSAIEALEQGHDTG